MAEVKLKSCPFCGSNDVAAGYGFGDYIVVCNNCESQTRYCETSEEAIEAWNRRADDGE